MVYPPLTSAMQLLAYGLGLGFVTGVVCAFIYSALLRNTDGGNASSSNRSNDGRKNEGNKNAH